MFIEGQEVKEIFWNEGLVRVGSNGIEKIVVEMQKGQFGEVPWFASYKDGKKYIIYNGAHLEGVIP